MEKEEKVQPTYVLFHPHILQNNKTIEFVAKHGSLFLATTFFICMILFHLNFKDQTWLLFLPFFVFYSFAYVFGRISNNETLQFLQILITTSIFTPYSFCVVNFLILNYVFNYGSALRFFLFTTLFFYSNVLHIVYRKHYVNDLSTPESVSTFNTVDFCHCLLLIVSYHVLLPLADMLRVSFDYYPNSGFQKFLNFSFYWDTPHDIIIVSYFVSVIVGLYIFVTHSNRSNRLAVLDTVEFDSNGRAWWSLYHRIGVAFSRMKHNCSLIPGVCCPASMKSSVQPEDSQKLPL
uniref:Uncharacterized protein n=1 Tax=Panagrellus redivivus TaxID=6233 RepID=A0A7E5A0X1_PANRE